MNQTWKVIWPYLKNKYIIAITVFAVWIMFFSQYSLTDRFRLAAEINEMEQDKEYYREQIVRDSIRLQELTTDRENLEKFAREQYYMKKKNEEIFVVIDEAP